MAKLPTVVLRHRISGVKRIMNAAEYAMKVGGISKDWRLAEYRHADTRDDIVERALREAEAEWKKTKEGRDDRPQRRYEDRAIRQNIILPEGFEPSAPAPAPSEEAVAAPNSPVEPSQEITPEPPTAPANEPPATPPKRGRGRPRKNPV